MSVEEMDEDFKYFFHDKGFGPAIHTEPVSASEIKNYSGKLPDQLLRYWDLYGWSGYAEGMFWTVNPAHYEPVVQAWLAGTGFLDEEDHHAIARGAFGEIYLWGEKSGQNLTISAPQSMIFPRDQREKIKAGKGDFLVRMFFSNRDKKKIDEKDFLEQPLFDRAAEKLGPLAPDEMYGFQPALALGGQADLKFLHKVKAIEHLVLLAQLHPPRIMTDIVALAKEKGLMK